MSGVWHFLTANGVVRAALSWATVMLLGYIARQVRQHVLHQRAAAAALLRHQRDTLRHQEQIHGLLDTSVPGGLTDVVRAIDDQMPAPCGCDCGCRHLCAGCEGDG